jgi:hypothetical protein
LAYLFMLNQAQAVALGWRRSSKQAELSPSMRDSVLQRAKRRKVC